MDLLRHVRPEKYPKQSVESWDGFAVEAERYLAFGLTLCSDSLGH